jgi:hypothetical protein
MPCLILIAELGYLKVDSDLHVTKLQYWTSAYIAYI